MLYPELQMPYMPVSQPSKEHLLEGAEEGRLELFEDVELAMVRFFFHTINLPLDGSHACSPFLAVLGRAGG
jgi:hypothetical protein